MPNPQSFKSHTRFDPLFHFFVIPLLLTNLVVTITYAVQHRHHNLFMHMWQVVMALALLGLAEVARSSALRAQNRVIRLEERLRLNALITGADAAHLQELSTRQLIALRFASDEELPGLVHRTLTQRMEPKAIKESIVSWRADHERV